MAVQVRQSTYRGRAGYLVCGRPSGSGWRLSIFTEDHDVADAIRDAYRNRPRAEAQEETDRLLRGGAK